MQLTSEDIFNVLYNNQKITVSESELKQLDASNAFLNEYIKGKIVYGVNTGFGPMAQYVINDEQQKQLQLNLIRSHAAGSGDVISPIFIKATLLARLNTLRQSYSAVSSQTVTLLKDFINYDIYPVIYQHGGVGASGDLIQLSHVALSLIGEGEVIYKGEIIPTIQAMDLCKLNPLKITIREGLALMNGTSTMNGIGYVNVFLSKNLVNWMIKLSSLMYEILSVYDDFFSAELNNTKKHEGQRFIAKSLRNQLEGSKLIKKRTNESYKFINETNVLENKMQSYYSIRCTPQILGPIHDAICYSEKVLNNEINSVNDNPIIDVKSQNVFHGGNFHGDYVSYEMDKLKLGIIKLSILSERQLNYLFNDKINGILPPFINKGILGLNLGLQGTQFPSTSTVSENMTLGSSNYINNISTNNDNQDVVSMGTNAALIANKVIMNTYEVIAIQYMAIMNAVQYLDIESQMSEKNQKLYKEAKTIMSFSDATDTPHYKTLRIIKEYLLKLSNEEKCFYKDAKV